MSAELVVVGLLARCQAAWLEHFPTLHKRAQWHIVHHLCTKATGGASAGQLHGLVKQVFLLDDATVKERVVELLRAGFCTTEFVDETISARTIIMPTKLLVASFDAYVEALGVAFAEALKKLGESADSRHFGAPASSRESILASLELLREQWAAALDGILNELRLSPARRLEAKRHLMSMSHGTIVLVLLEHALRRPAEHETSGVLADHLGMRLLQLSEQNFHTTRDHIAYLMDAGLLARRAGKSLHVGLSPPAAAVFAGSLGGVAAALVAQHRGARAQRPSPPAGSAVGADAASAPANDYRRHGPGSEDTGWHKAPRRGNAPDQPGLHVDIVRPREARRRIVSEAEPIVVGRAPACDVVLDSPEVSRNHCRIEALNGAVLVTDLGSRNGTFVNGTRIEAPLSIRSDDEVEIGGFCLACSIIGGDTALHDRPMATKATIAPGVSAGRR
jgi:hypothetical protein